MQPPPAPPWGRDLNYHELREFPKLGIKKHSDGLVNHELRIKVRSVG